MNEVRLTGKKAGGFTFLKRPLAASWAPIPLRLIVGYGFMEHAFAKLSKGPEKPSPRSCTPSACPRRI